jgi:hypothetical protein
MRPNGWLRFTVWMVFLIDDLGPDEIQQLT